MYEATKGMIEAAGQQCELFLRVELQELAAGNWESAAVMADAAASWAEFAFDVARGAA